MAALLSGIDNILIYIDDVVIATETLEEHAATLRQVFERFDAAGLALNKEKCHIGRPHIQFLGHIWSSNGITPSPEKQRALKEMPLPDSLQSLHSFLGLAAYVGQHTVPHYSTLCQPLWKMMKETTIHWTPERCAVFEKLCVLLSEKATLAYFDPNKPTVVQTDASGKGLGAVLLQDSKPVIYVSRTLTDTERRYSQIEREFLAIVFGMKRLEKYLIGLKFELQTDHKPLLSIFKKPIDCLSNRLQRWLITVQHLHFHVSHIHGEDNVLSDCLSRNAIRGAPTPEEQAEYTVCGIMKSYPLDLREVAANTVEDATLQALITAVQSNWVSPSSKALLPYYHIRDQISLKVQNNGTLVVMSNRVVIPQGLRRRLLESVHEGHLGMNKMKAMLRSYAYWPGMTRDIEEFVRKCIPCVTFQQRGDAAPLIPVAEMETEPWSRVALDLTGPSNILDGHVLLTLIDLYSRYPEATIIKQGNSREIIHVLSAHFARYGLPRRIITDNGTPFVSQEFEEFLKSKGIVHSLTSLYYPRANSTVERLHSTLKSRLRRIRLNSPIPLSEALHTVLLDIRSTPNDVTGETPFWRFFNRPMRTKLSLLSVSDDENGPTSRPRDVVAEYSQRGREKTYHEDDFVLARKGDGQPFNTPGKIMRRVGRYTYEVFINGRRRRYNQRNLKPSSEPPMNDDFSAYEAVDEVARETTPADNVISTHGTANDETKETGTDPQDVSGRCGARSPDGESATRATRRYNLRGRYVDPLSYKV